ncbi:MAG: ribosome maturation factor RimM [Solirubrobacteraceae bacterium]|jgi:16S rRNA processing protein RimM
MGDARHWLRAGAVGRPHGLDGSFHVNDPVPGLLSLGATVQVGDAELEIDRLAGHERRVILRFTGHASREAAEALRGTEIRAPREAAPPLEEDEWWATDLEGCTVHDGERSVGVVTRLLALPSCEVLEVSRSADPDGPALLVPLVGDAVRTVDVEAGVIDVDLAFLGEA